MISRREGMQKTRRARISRMGGLLVAAGALVCLTPLFLWALDVYNQAPIELPVVSQLPDGSPAPPVRPVPISEAPVSTGPAVEPVVVAQPQAGFSYRLQIPSISVNVPVQPGIDDSDLHKGAGHYPQTPLPGEKGNAAMAGHRTIKGKPAYFYSLDRLRAGDPIYVVYPDKRLEFAVERVFVTHPYDLSVLQATEHSQLTLTTCDPPGTDENRLIVQARLVKVNDLN